MSVSSSYSINALTAPDNYTPQSTIEGVPIDRVLIDVVNQAILWQLKMQVSPGVSSGGNWESSEKYMLPGSRVINRQGIVGVRFRAAVPASRIPAGQAQAIASIEAVV